MLSKYLLPIRLVLVITFAVFAGVWVADQYGLVQSMVRFVCINCLGLGG